MGAHVEILGFAGCPNHEPAVQLVERVITELGVDATVELVEVPDAASAIAHRFLGSPSIRVNGRDIEPGAEERTDFGLSCRVFRTDSGLAGMPEQRWLRAALT